MQTNSTISFRRILAILFILGGSTFAWFVLGTSLVVRSETTSRHLGTLVNDGWGSSLQQNQPQIWTRATSGQEKRHAIQPADSQIDVKLDYEPRRKGLLWYRAYHVAFEGRYRVVNTFPVAQTMYFEFELPSTQTSYFDFAFQLGEKDLSGSIPVEGRVAEAVSVEPGEAIELRVSYRARGLDQWTYNLGAISMVQNFHLAMTTNFAEINFPVGTGSPTQRREQAGGWALDWNYPHVLSPRSIGMEMPKRL